MGKKKRSSQNSNNVICHGDSSESESSKDSSQLTEASKIICSHVNKSSEITSIRKNIKLTKDPYSCCTACKKNEPCKDGWVCLRCASFNCGPSEADHRTEHYKRPRSDEHFLAFQLSTNTIWCFKCEQEIPVDINKRVQGCIDLIKKQNSDSLLIKPKLESDTRKMNDNDVSSYFKTNACQPLGNGLQNKEMHLVDLNLPKVRGLMNLGNTCFFNSVLQCLAQTPGLVTLLEEMEGSGEKFYLELDGIVINTTLEKHKSSEISEQLARILTEVAGGGGEEVVKNSYSAVNPRSLLSVLTTRYTQFEGGDQHDAHELLRHLLDAVYKEDLKRYQVRVLEYIGYYASGKSKKSLDDVDEEKKKIGKKLNQKVCDTILIRPEHLFKGSLVSILQCSECMHISKRDETFLDLSLPVAQEKAQPPAIRKKQNSIDQLSSCKSLIEEKENSEETPAPMSKCLQRKVKRKMAKNQGNNAAYLKNQINANIKDENQGEPTIEEEDKKDSTDGEQSDADVEDNEDIACEERDPKMEIVESGYSSEKQMSARGSPVTTQSAETQGCDFDKPMTDVSIYSAIPGDPTALLTTRAESGLGSIQELTVTIPEECNPDCTSQESVQVNASNGSPDISSDSQQGNFRNVDLSTEYQLPHCNDSSSFRREMVLDWNCSVSMNDAQSHSQDSSSASLSVSPRCSSRDNLNVSPKGSPVSGSHSNNMSVCTTLPNSNDNMSICDSLPENVSLLLNSPTKNKEEKSDESEERMGVCQLQEEKEKKICSPDEPSKIDFCDLPKEDNSGAEEIINLEHQTQNFSHDGSGVPLGPDFATAESNISEELINMRLDEENNSHRQISRCSPVDHGELTDLTSELLKLSLKAISPELDSGLLKLSLEGVASAGDSERRSSPVTLDEGNQAVYNDQGETGFVLVPPTQGPIPLPPPSPPTALFTAPYKFTHPEPAVATTNCDRLYRKHKIEEGEYSLQSCLSQFTAAEILTGNNKVGCEACTERINKGNKEKKTVYQNSSKQLLISKLPPIVIFHLKRFQVQRTSFRKISRHVDFPLVLDISPYCSLNEPERTVGVGPILYSLYGVVEHIGTLHGGHYVAYVKVRSLDKRQLGVPPPGKWYYISDSRVSNIDESEVLTKQAYLLFYERIL